MILVDGSSLLHRVLNTDQADLQDSRGRYTGGLHGFLVSIGALVHKRRFRDAIIIAWDLGVPLFRRELFRNYKPHKSAVGDVAQTYQSDMNLLNRTEEEATGDFLEQYQISRRLLHNYFLPKLGCLSVQVNNCEADDIIAYCSFRLKTIEDVTILSTDRDLIQLLHKNNNYYDGRVHEFWTVDDVIEKYGLIEEDWKHHWLLAKAIAGDTSDKIPGVGGIGFDAAMAYARQIICAKRKTLGEALQAVQRIPRGKQSAYENLKVSTDTLIRNYNLMDLSYPVKNNLPIVNEIKAGVSLGYSCCELDLENVLIELHDMNMNKAKQYSQYISESTEKINYANYAKVFA